MLLVNLQEIPVHFENAGEPLLRLLIDARKRAAECAAGLDRMESARPIRTLRRKFMRSASGALVPFTIDGSEFEESGATAVEEVGFTLAAAIDFLAEMQARNVDIDRAAASIEFSFAIGANYFFQIAKFRAFRMLWARAVESFGGSRESARARIHARTSRWNKTIYDPHVNILRATTEAMSAVLGGADSISVAPFDECYKTPDEASRRLARNTQIILKHEACCRRSPIPALDRTAWRFSPISSPAKAGTSMQRIEAAGGYRKALANGDWPKALEQSLAAQRKSCGSAAPHLYRDQSIRQSSEKALDRIEPRAAASRSARRAELRAASPAHGTPRSQHRQDCRAFCLPNSAT